MNLAQVVGCLAAEVTGPLTQAMHRLSQLAAEGSMDRSGLTALRSEIDGARRAGLMGQRIARFAHGRRQNGAERVDLGPLLRDVLTDLAAHAEPGSPGHRHTIVPTQVAGDASLLHTLVEAAAAWAQAQTLGGVAWEMDADTWQPVARLVCRFPGRNGPCGDQSTDEGMDSLDWLLLRYAAHVAGASVARDLHDGQVRLCIRLPNLLSAADEPTETPSPDGGPSTRSLLTGCQLLVLAARREPRERVRAALRDHEVFIDCVPSVHAAEAYCDDGSPQVLLYDSAFAGEALHALHTRLAKLTPAVTLVELLPCGRGCEVADGVVRLGSEGLAQTLPPLLQMELVRQA